MMQRADLRHFHQLRSLTLGRVFWSFWVGEAPQLPASLTALRLEDVNAVYVPSINDLTKTLTLLVATALTVVPKVLLLVPLKPWRRRKLGGASCHHNTMPRCA